MTGLRFWRNLIAVPAIVAIIVFSAGCGNKQQPTGTGKPTPPAGKPATKAEKTALTAGTTGILKGKVTLDGTPPPAKDLEPDMKAKPEFSHCLKDDPKNRKEPTWVVSPNKEVKNVVVWLRPPEGKYFSVPDDQKKRTDIVSMDQPFCMFIPHAVSLYPSYFDGKEQKPTGQKFEIKNTAPITHNTSWRGQNTLVNPGANPSVPAGGKLDVEARTGRPKEAAVEELISIKCDIHPWMSAKAWVFDHPYSAVTGDDGTFEIKNAPEGVELVLTYWHETFGSKPKTEPITLTAGKPTEKNIVIKP